MATPRYRMTSRILPGAMCAAWCGVIVVMLAASGCATPPGVVFAPAGVSGGLVWPAAPEVSRVRYLGALVSSDDLHAGRSGGESLAQTLFGRETPRGMIAPIGVCTDGKERVFVVDSAGGASGEQNNGGAGIHVFDLDSQKYEMWTGDEATPLVLPVAAAFDASHARLIVADAGAGVLRCFDTHGRITDTLGIGALQRPCGVAVHPETGSIYVADVAAHQVVVLSPDGNAANRMGNRGSAPGEFNFPTYLAFDAQHNLVVSDSLNFRVQVFTPSGKFVRQIGRKGDLPGYFSQPKGVAVDAAGNTWVVDANFEAVQVFDADGSLLLPIGREGRGPGEFWLPAGIAADGKGRVWVADTYNKRVQVFQLIDAAKEIKP